MHASPPTDTLTRLPSAREIAERFFKAGKDIIAIARDVAAALDVDPKFADELQDAGISKDSVWKLERFGRGQMHESLFFSASVGGRRLMNAPLSEQARALTDGITVLDRDEKTVRNIGVHDLTPVQAKQVFARGFIRNLTQQRTWIRDQIGKQSPILDAKNDYRVGKDFVVTTRPGKWSRQLLLQWLTQMT